MHKNLNFERFWKCVQINFFVSVLMFIQDLI